MVEAKYCNCGQQINVEHGSNRTCRFDKMRYFEPNDTRDGVCLFRCPKCVEVVEYLNLNDTQQTKGEMRNE